MMFEHRGIRRPTTWFEKLTPAALYAQHGYLPYVQPDGRAFHRDVFKTWQLKKHWDAKSIEHRNWLENAIYEYTDPAWQRDFVNSALEEAMLIINMWRQDQQYVKNCNTNIYQAGYKAPTFPCWVKNRFDEYLNINQMRGKMYSGRIHVTHQSKKWM